VCTKVYDDLGNAESHVKVAAEVLKEMKSPAKKVAALRK
jgi:hypothetical protein